MTMRDRKRRAMHSRINRLYASMRLMMRSPVKLEKLFQAVMKATGAEGGAA